MSLYDHRFLPEATTTADPSARDRLWPAILGCWLFACVILSVTCARAIGQSVYPDPDDILRMLEVRDLLGGQSWWDVSQHRFASGLMHWSRLVDLPLAAVELIARPLLGARGAEMLALVVVPLVTLGVVMALAATITRRLLDTERARATLLLAPLSVPLIYQMRPMRIDHHGWQVVLAMGALLAFLDRRAGWRSGAIGGLCLATLLTISLEGLPITAALLGLVALGWVLDPTRRAQLNGATGVAFGSALLLHLVTRGPAFWSPACDAMAPVWLAILGTAAVGTALATRLPLARPGYPGITLRLAAMAAVGGASGAALLLVDPRCTAGPFQALPPIVHDLWYEIVSEGLPVWDQLPVWAAMCVGMPIVGLIGSAIALRDAKADRRAAWWLMIGAQVAAFGLSLLVSRSAATANAMALPGAALVMVALLTRARRIPSLLPRVLATAGTLVLVTPGAAALAFLGPPAAQWTVDYQADRARHPRPPCTSAEDPRALGALPAARLFAPIDIAPEIVAATGHHAITSGHHRNALAMADVLTTFTGTPAHAEAMIRRYRADYVVGCPGFSETSLYDSVAPNGFWSQLERGKRFDWLTPVRIPGSPVLAWRVNPLPEHAPAL